MSASLRSSRATFWHLGPDRLVAAVVCRSEADDEPVLEACAASYAAPTGRALFAPGIVEVAWALGAGRLAHIAALGGGFCRVESFEPEPPRRGRRRAPVPDPGAATDTIAVIRDFEGLRVRAERHVVQQAASLFRRARLHLLALDCEPCAIATLSEVLGIAEGSGAKCQPLAAVSVRPEAERAAEALGADLAVPVGLAVAWFGGRRA